MLEFQFSVNCYTGVDRLSVSQLTQLSVFGTINGHTLPVMTPAWEFRSLHSLFSIPSGQSRGLRERGRLRSNVVFSLQAKSHAATWCNELSCKVSSYTQRSAEALKGKFTKWLLLHCHRQWMFMTVTFGLR